MKTHISFKIVMAILACTVGLSSCKKDPQQVTETGTDSLTVFQKELQAKMDADGKLSAVHAYRLKMAAIMKLPVKTSAALKPVIDLDNKPVLVKSGDSKLIKIGDQPETYGAVFEWDRSDRELLLVTYINAANSMGTTITNLKAGDEVQITSAAGTASFSEDHGSSISSVISLLAAGAQVGADVVGHPEVGALISAGESYAQNKFKDENVLHKLRDTWGVDPGSGHKARQEGGIIICMPEAGGALYSGNGDHDERWIKDPGDRTDANRPNHIVPKAFFPRAGNVSHNTRIVAAPGEMYILPWDHNFTDNAGYYRVFIHLKKGSNN